MISFWTASSPPILALLAAEVWAVTGLEVRNPANVDVRCNADVTFFPCNAYVCIIYARQWIICHSRSVIRLSGINQNELKLSISVYSNVIETTQWLQNRNCTPRICSSMDIVYTNCQSNTDPRLSSTELTLSRVFRPVKNDLRNGLELKSQPFGPATRACKLPCFLRYNIIRTWVLR